jgi:microcystin-dependent protein
MVGPFIGEIKMFGFNYAPRGWATCDGQTLPIEQHLSLFSLLGTTYGGDGDTTFGLPDLRGAFPTHQGQGPGRTERQLGDTGGQEQVTLSTQQMPAHDHNASLSLQLSADSTLRAASSLKSTVSDPSDNALSDANKIYVDDDANTDMRSGSVVTTVSDDGSSVSTANTGGGQAHDNMPPFQVVTYCIALTGLYPPRT